MKKISTLLLTAVFAAGLATGCSTTNKADMSNVEKMAMPTAEDFQKFAMATPQHEVLHAFAGTWKTDGKFWMMPGEAPQVSSGKSVISKALGGKFMEEQYSGEWMGSPFTGIGYTGYDTVSNEYTSTWMDSATSVLHVMKGSYNEVDKELVFFGENNCPMTGQKISGKTVIKMIDDSTRMLESYMIDADGNEQKGMEIKYTRIG